MSEQLKPCPFCGVIPEIYFVRWREISETAGAYQLEAGHTRECFIRHMDGVNPHGRMTSFNKECLIEAWNHRAELKGEEQ